MQKSEAVFKRYVSAVAAGSSEQIAALIDPAPQRPPFARCEPALSDRACLIDYLDRTVIHQHTRLTVLTTTTDGDTVSVKLEVRNDLTRAAGVDRLAGTDRVRVNHHGKIVEFAFLRDEQDEQTRKFFDFMRTQRPSPSEVQQGGAPRSP